ncbi:ricin B lectin (PTP6f) [Vairimorpha necatrix]|uniref:Ricin B lectin (PTP6f) n=1 Tax=Vairimorpha necatrix TaxID=6039 RepID=A0AAX4JFG5_9MICR
MIFIFFCLSLQEYIKHYSDDKFIKGSMTDGIAHSVDKSKVTEDDNFSVERQYKTYQKSFYTKPNRKYLTMGDESKLKYKDSKPKHESQLYRSSLLKAGLFVLKNRDKCVEYDRGSDTYNSKKCSSSDNQKFHLLDKPDEAV